MASLANDPGGLRRILFKDRDGNRRTVRLGKVPINQARTILSHIERLVAAQIDSSAPPDQTSRWLAGVNETLRNRLERVGLVETAGRKARTVGEVLAAYRQRPRWLALKPSSRLSQEKAIRHFTAYFGDDFDLMKLTEAAAEDFRGSLTLPKSEGGAGLAQSTADRACSIAWSICRYAVRDRILSLNPFDEIPHRTSARGDNVMVSDADARKVLAELAGSEYRLLFGLCRWGGLRIPSEPRRLRWCDVDWENDRFLVHSVKTERHAGKATRWVPIFPELAPLFNERYADAAEGDELVLPMMAGRTDSAFSGVLSRAVARAGVAKWSRIWHSMRATRQTELEQLFPTYVVCEWLGNSESIARRHYLKVTPQHFAEAAQKAAQHSTVRTGNTVDRNRTNAIIPGSSQ